MYKQPKIGQKQFNPSAIIKSIDNLQRELDVVKYHMLQYKDERVNKLPQCEKCGIRNVRMRIDKTYFCYSCGYDSDKK